MLTSNDSRPQFLAGIVEGVSLQFAFLHMGCNNVPLMLLTARTDSGGGIKLLLKQAVERAESDSLKAVLKP
jgi:hypothetical protein